jgi:RimJ/RimL family protein N-acetyltransferase
LGVDYITNESKNQQRETSHMTDPLLTPTLHLPQFRAQLRPWCATDVAALAKYANDERIAENLRDTFPHPYTRQDAEFYLCLMADQQRDLHLAVEVDGVAVGSVGVHFKTDVRRRSAEIGYWLGRAYWGRCSMALWPHCRTIAT